MSRLTLSVDEHVVSRAKRYARQHGVSVSEMVETYLDAVAAPPKPAQPDAPILRSLRGTVKKGELAAFKKHLAAKYR